MGVKRALRDLSKQIYIHLQHALKSIARVHDHPRHKYIHPCRERPRIQALLSCGALPSPLPPQPSFKSRQAKPVRCSGGDFPLYRALGRPIGVGSTLVEATPVVVALGWTVVVVLPLSADAIGLAREA
jgi:hypothetical protein